MRNGTLTKQNSWALQQARFYIYIYIICPYLVAVFLLLHFPPGVETLHSKQCKTTQSHSKLWLANQGSASANFAKTLHDRVCGIPWTNTGLGQRLGEEACQKYFAKWLHTVLKPPFNVIFRHREGQAEERQQGSGSQWDDRWWNRSG